MTSREWDRAYAEVSGDWSEYVKKWRGDMTERMAIVPRTPKAEQQKAGGSVNDQGFDFAHETYAQMLAASPHAGKVSAEKFDAAIKIVDQKSKDDEIGSLWEFGLEFLAALGLEIAE